MAGIREKLRDPKVGGAVAGVIALLAVYLVMKGSGPSGPKFYEQTWYYDLGKGELFAAKGGQHGPFPSPSGGDAVEAEVYGCGSCAEQKIGWLQKYSPEALEAIKNADQFAIAMKEGTFIKRPDDADWVLLSSPEGQKITNVAIEDCKKVRIVTCYPGST